MNELDPTTLALLAAGGGLLQASGPQLRPTSTGQAIGGGLLQGANAYQGALAQNRQNAQAQALIELEKKKSAMLEQQLKQAQQQFEMQRNVLQTAGLLGQPPQAQQPQVPSVMQGSGSPPPPWMPPQLPQNQPQQNGNFPMSFDQVTALKIAGGPNLLPNYQAANPPIKWLDTGSEYIPTHPQTGVRIQGVAPLPKVQTPGEQATLGQRQYEFGNLSASQKAGQQVDRANLLYNTGINLGAPGSVPGGPQAQGRPQTPPVAPRPTAAPATPGLTPKGAAEVAQKRAEDQPAQQRMVQSAQAKANIVNTKVDEALKRLDGWFTLGKTGLRGAVWSNVPGTDAYDLGQTLDTIKANLGFSELQAMRQASPTGGALGQVAVRELEFLQAAVSSLKQGQNEETLRKNLGDVKKHFNAWKEAVEQNYAQMYGGQQKLPSGWDIQPVPGQ